MNPTRFLRGRTIRLIVAVPAVAGVWLFVTGTASAATPPFTQCPGIGLDSRCAVLFTVNPDGSVTMDIDPSQPAFDGVEDSLVGVQNNSSAPASTLSM